MKPWRPEDGTNCNWRELGAHGPCGICRSCRDEIGAMADRADRELDDALQEAVARIRVRTQELIITFPDITPTAVVRLALMEEAALHGVPGQPPPSGVLRKSVSEPACEVCDTCGAPATHAATDILEKPNHTSGFMEFRPIGRVKYGCDQHSVKSETHKSFGHPWAKP
jgi:hypothetical protein